YEIVSGPRGEAAVKIGEHVFSLQKISSLVLAEVKDVAERWLGTPISRAVITVPAYYNDNQRQAVRAAGALAGLDVERIVNEPTAAAIAFAHGRALEQRVMVYDLGGGTFDTSVLELHGNLYEVISTGGDTFLGGDDVLTNCGLKPADVGEVLLVGGQSRMPLVRSKLREYFGKEPSKAVHPDEAVALGAAVLANSMQSGDIGGMVLVDVLPMSIGVG